MKIDIRDVKSRWINLDSAEENAKSMVELLDSLGIKDHKRSPGRIIAPPDPSTDKTIYHYVGCAQAHIDILENNDAPVLVLEDDVKTTDWQTPILDIPDDTDAVYLGISHGDGRYFAQDLGNDYAKIKGVFACHAILYLTDKYRKAVVEVAKDFVYTRHQPFDLGVAQLQAHFNIITPHLPHFYQSDERTSSNKWENLTRQPLRMLSRRAGVLGPGYGDGPKGI